MAASLPRSHMAFLPARMGISHPSHRNREQRARDQPPCQALSSGPPDDGTDKAGKKGLLLHFLENRRGPHSSWTAHRKRRWATCGEGLQGSKGEGETQACFQIPTLIAWLSTPRQRQASVRFSTEDWDSRACPTTS